MKSDEKGGKEGKRREGPKLISGGAIIVHDGREWSFTLVHITTGLSADVRNLPFFSGPEPGPCDSIRTLKNRGQRETEGQRKATADGSNSGDKKKKDKKKKIGIKKRRTFDSHWHSDVGSVGVS